MLDLLKKPSAWGPMAMSLFIIAMEIFILTTGIGVDTSGDEGVAAHLFQIAFVLEIVLIPLFALMWLPREGKTALAVLALQLALFLAMCFPVFYFHW